MLDDYYVYFEDQFSERRRLYTKPLEIITAYSADEVDAALARMEACQDKNLYLAGYFSYELGYVLEPALQALLPNTLGAPLLKFGVFEAYEDKALHAADRSTLDVLKPEWTRAHYSEKFDTIMDYIHAGDVYQINLTFPVTGTYTGSAAAVYNTLKSRQPVKYGCVIYLGGEAIVSLSPELFFKTKGRHITMRPMKGTSARGASPAQDKKMAQALQNDIKNRAENLMIVDLLRNDAARISKAGTVKVDDLFSIETYPSLHTMTSGISATLNTEVSLRQTLRALFPCGSVTGAPKIRAMEIIKELEASPRGEYCGALGLIDPNGDMRFSVGIRTLSLGANGRFRYPVGSGIVADSNGMAEYDECLLKASFLHNDYDLLETIGWDDSIGFMHLDLHMQRLARSAHCLGFSYDEDTVFSALRNHVKTLCGAHKVRLALHKTGRIALSSERLKLLSFDEAWPVTLCKAPLDSGNALLAHKTTRRAFIEGERKRLSVKTGCKEILLFNERGELCEGSYTNVFVRIGGALYTPPLASGLLPGILRQVMIANGQVAEKTLDLEDVLSAQDIYIGNSVRGLIRAALTGDERV